VHTVTGYMYYNRMSVPRQEPVVELSGRVNQKRRTRKAVIDAARAILERGERPTVALAAEEDMVSRTTDYRYFPTQESLLLELTVGGSVAEIDEILTRPLDGTPPQARLVDFVERFNRYTLNNEALTRTALRHYMDVWLAAERSGEATRQIREGRRYQWIASLLEPLADDIPPGDYQRLQAALCLVVGGEAITVLRDICQLDTDQAIAVTRWAAETLLAASLNN
jgi:AcrR family transcriptional regulator